MHKDIKIGEYLKEVCNQIRWKRAHDVLSEELENHIIDQRDAFIQLGMDEATAIDKAIEEMGDPILVGSELDRTHRPKTEWSIIALTALLIFIGLAIRFFEMDNTISSTIPTNIISLIIGICCMTAMYLLDFTFIVKHSKVIYWGIIIAILSIYFVSPVPYGGGNTYGVFIFMLMPTAFAALLYNLRSKGYYGIILSTVYFSIPLFIIRIFNNISSIMLYIVVSYSLISYAIIKGWFKVNRIKGILLYYVPTILMVATFFINNAYIRSILYSIFSPSKDPMEDGYIPAILKNMLHHSNFIGSGNLGVDYINKLPSKDTDYLLTNLIYRYGWILFFFIITLIGIFLIRSTRLCLKQKSLVSRLITLSILGTFTMQVLLYIAANFAVLSLNPLVLPLISYGSTSLITNMILIGIMLSVFKSGDLVRDNSKSLKYKKNKIIQLIDGKIIIDLHMN